MISFKLFNFNILVDKYATWSGLSYRHKVFNPVVDCEWETIVDVGYWRIHINK